MTGTMTLLDHRGQPIQSAVERSLSVQRAEHQRRIRAKFDAAQTTDENTRHWANADYLGPNSELDPAVRQKLRSRARYEYANNTYAKGMLRTLANDTIGTGPALQITDRRYSEADAAAIEERLWQWMQATSLPQKLQTMRLSKARDGEAFAMFFTNPRGSDRVRLDLRTIEADMVASPVPSWDRQSLTDGLILDDFDNVVGYTVLTEHPGERTVMTAPLAFETIPARFMIHLFNQDRAGQCRGVPEVTPALPLFAQLRRYTLAVIRSAESAAIPSWIIQTQAMPQEGFDAAEPFDAVDTERGMGVTLPVGYQMNQLKAEQPTSTYPQFKREILAEIARCLGIPYNVAAGDSSGYNYSSGRLDHRSYYKALRVERAMTEAKALKPIIGYWWEEAASLPGYLPESAFRQPLPMHEWRWDGDEHVDPTKEVTAAADRVRYGFTAMADECSRLGTDPEVVHQKNAAVLGMSIAEYRERLAITLLGPPPALPAPQATPTDGEDDDEEDDDA